MFPVEAFRTTLAKAVQIFVGQNIIFHLTGGITSIVYGEPRMTQDLDIVVGNSSIANRIQPFIANLSHSDFLFDEKSIRTAIAAETMFQLFDSVEALKLDIYPREMIPGELQRSAMVEVFEGMTLPVASRMDATLSKLVWISKGSHKSRRDVRQLYRLADEHDRDRIRQFAQQLRLNDLLDIVLSETDEIG